MSGSPPASVIKDGNLKASIWENEGQKGTYYTTTFAKVYEDRNGNLRDTSVFNNADLLKVSELARQAYTRTNELRQELLQAREAEQSQPRERASESRSAEPRVDDRKARAEEFLKNRRESRSRTRDFGQER